MKLVDAHIHLSDAEYVGYVDKVLADAKAVGVSALVTNALDLKTCQNDLKLSQQYSGFVYPALGIHPWNVNVLKENELEETIAFITEQNSKTNIAAIGEIGLDYKYETVWEKQMMVFNKMLHLAEKLNLPVIIHSRGTTDKIVDMLPSYAIKRVLLHWFSHPLSALSKAMDQGYFITEGPPVVYSNGIREVVKQTPITNLLTETDGPVKYWKVPFNGQLTTPAYLQNVVEAVAEIKNMPVEKVTEQVARNFEQFFNIKIV